MRVLILGGTSFFGKEIAKDFYETGHEVTLFTRGEKSPSDLPALTQVKGNRQSLDDLQRVNQMGPWDVVIDNIGYSGSDGELLVRAFPKVKRILFTSTISVYRYGNLQWPLKETEINPQAKPAEENLSDIHWKYARGKLDAENAVRKAQVPWTILRPTVVIGPYDVTQRSFWYVSRLLDGGPLLLANGGEQSFRLAYSLDVSRAYLDVLGTTKTEGQAYFLAQQEVITLKDYLEVTARALGITPEWISIPREVLGELGGPLATMANIIPSITKAMNDFGYRPTPFAKFATTTALWFRDHWQGDKAKLLETRSQELALAQQWKESFKNFSRESGKVSERSQ